MPDKFMNGPDLLSAFPVLPSIRTSESVSLLLILLLIVSGCSSTERDETDKSLTRSDTISQYSNGTPKAVHFYRADSLIERRFYRPTGILRRIEGKGSTRTYLDLHNPDSAFIFKDYLQGRWRKRSVDPSESSASAFYIFEDERLTFENPTGTPLETVGVQYENNRTLETEDGMSVEATIVTFDTVEVTGYTLIRMRPVSE